MRACVWPWPTCCETTLATQFLPNGEFRAGLDAQAAPCILGGVAEGHDDDSGGGDDVLRKLGVDLGVTIRPEDVPIHLDLARAYTDMGRLDDAALEFELVLEVEPYHPVAQAELMAIRMRKSSQ
jgi:hypothetical protein